MQHARAGLTEYSSPPARYSVIIVDRISCNGSDDPVDDRLLTRIYTIHLVPSLLSLFY